MPEHDEPEVDQEAGQEIIPADADLPILIGAVQALVGRVHDLKGEVVAYRNLAKAEVDRVERERLDLRRKDALAVIVVLAVIAGVVFGVWRYVVSVDEHFGRTEAQTCLAFWENRQSLRDLIEGNSQPLQAPPEAPPWVQPLLDNLRAQGEASRELALRRIPLPDCSRKDWLEDALERSESVRRSDRAAEE